MPRRDPPSGRRHAIREPALRVLLVCGAEKTESAYFKGLRTWLATSSIDIKIVERSKSPDQVVEYARDHCGHRDFDQTWCIVDVDHYEVDGGKVTSADVIARAVGIELAVSNPCFEYWLLLHHAEGNAAFPHCDAVVGRLRSSLKSYDKTKLRFADFADGVQAAIERAKRRDPSGERYALNPSTAVWVLVEKLLEQRQ